MNRNFFPSLVFIFLSIPKLGLAIDTLGEPDFTEETARISFSDIGRKPASSEGGIASNGLSAENSDVDIEPTQASKFGVQEFSIIVTEKGFFPNKVIVRRNIPVNLYLTATDSRSLCFVMKKGDFNFHQGVGSKNVERISFHPTETGPFEFHCPINKIKGNLIVRD